jgi:spastic paraplegia 7
VFCSQLAEALLLKETLNYDEVVELIGPPLYESAKKKIDPVEFEDSLNSLSEKEEK